MTILHGVSASPYVRKVQAVLELKGIDYTNNPIIPFGDKTALLALNPLGKIPVLEDSSVTIGDSSVICAYLEKVYPDLSLYPSDPSLYAQAIWLEKYAAETTSVLGAIFFQRALNPTFFDTPTDEDAVEKIISQSIPPIFTYLEEQLGQQDFFVDNTLSIADIAVASPFVNVEFVGFTVDSGKWPQLAAFVKRIFALPEFNNKLELP